MDSSSSSRARSILDILRIDYANITAAISSHISVQCAWKLALNPSISIQASAQNTFPLLTAREGGSEWRGDSGGMVPRPTTTHAFPLSLQADYLA